eukprot:GFYU01003274.1.p1 GENE.GFYU01003274.1~~GFYU01003274.1.p1  ORF type:complete len:1454 (-),score=511.55 GFYU01003274.1:104-4168(-)
MEFNTAHTGKFTAQVFSYGYAGQNPVTFTVRVRRPKVRLTVVQAASNTTTLSADCGLDLNDAKVMQAAQALLDLKPAVNAGPGSECLGGTAHKPDWADLLEMTVFNGDVYAAPGFIINRYQNQADVKILYLDGVQVLVVTDHRKRRHQIAIRGSQNYGNWLSDFKAWLAYNDFFKIKAHYGFAKETQSIITELEKLQMDPTYSTKIVGHSLGASVAALMMVYYRNEKRDRNMMGYAFGTPRVTDAETAETLDDVKLIRVVNEQDLISVMPPWFVNFGPEIVLDENSWRYYTGPGSRCRTQLFPTDPFTAMSSHFLVVQLNRLQKMAGYEVPLPNYQPMATLAAPLPIQPIIKVVDKKTNTPVQGARVMAKVTNAAQDASLRMSGQVSEPADANGLARFEDLSIIAGKIQALTLSYHPFDVEEWEEDDLGSDTVPADGAVSEETRRRMQAALVTDEPATEDKKVTLSSAYRLEIVRGLPKSVSMGAPLSTPPAVKVVNELGAVVAGTEVSVVLPEKIQAEGLTAVSGTDGVATFKDLKVTDGVLGLYTPKFTLPGQASISGPDFYLSFAAGRLEVTTVPTSTVLVGQPFAVTVQATDAGENPLPNAPVALQVQNAAGNDASAAAAINAVSTRGLTDASGNIEFIVTFQSGTSGAYSLVAVFGDRKSVPSTPITMENDVQTVEITTTMESSLGYFAIVGSSVEAIRHIKPPVVRVVDKNGKGIDGMEVRMVITPQEGNVQTSYDAATTNLDGSTTFNNLHFTDGLTGEYQVRFSCLGVQSAPQNIVIRNHLRPDPARLLGYDTIAYVMAALSVPLFWANSGWEPRIMMFIGTVLGLVYFTIAITEIGADLSQRGFLDGFQVLMRVMVLLAFAGTLMGLARCFRPLVYQDAFHTWYQRKLGMYQDVVRTLLHGRWPLVQALPAPTDLSDKIMNTINPRLHKTQQPYRGTLKLYFTFPLRFLMTLGTSLLILFYALVSGVAIVLWAAFNIKTEFQAVVDHQVDEMHENADKVAIAALVGESNPDKVSELNALLLPSTRAEQGDSETFPDLLENILLFDVDHLISSTELSGGLACAIAAPVVFISWLLICRNYKRKHLAARKGQLEGSLHQLASKHPVRQAAKYIGTHVGSTGLAFMGMFTTLWFLIFIFLFEPTRKHVLGKTLTFITTYLITELIEFVAIRLAGAYLVSGAADIKDRRLFALYDIFMMFWTLWSGMLKAILRFVIGLVCWTIIFLRLDCSIDLLGSLDKGHDAYQAMLAADAYYNNPCFAAASNIFIGEGGKRGRERLLKISDDDVMHDKVKSSVIARNRWHLAYTLLNNPTLIQERVAPLADSDQDVSDVDSDGSGELNLDVSNVPM